MSAWEAEIKPPQLDGGTYPVAGLKAVAGLGAEMQLGLALADYLPQRLEPGTRVVLRNEGKKLELEALFGEDRWVSSVRSAAWAGEPSARGPFAGARERRLCQRRPDEGAAEFVFRAIGAGVALRSETVEWMNEALPQYACLAAPAFSPAEARLARILAAAGAGASRAAAWFGPLCGEHRLCVVDDEPDSVNRLDGDWRVVGRPSARTAVVERRIGYDADPDETAQRLCFAENPLDGEDGAPPVVPGLVEFDERFWFATEATTEIHFNPPTPGNPRGRTTLQLSDWSTFVAETQAPRSFAQVYLGLVMNTQADEDWRLLHIRPPSEDEDTLAFPRWAAVDGEGEKAAGLLAFEAAPAPTTDEGCALHVRRRPGDPVVFVVNDAGPPVVLGALSGHCDYAEKYDVHIGRSALFGGVLHLE